MAQYTAYAENPNSMHYSSGKWYGDGWHGLPRNVCKW